MFGFDITVQQLEVYAEHLADISRERLAEAFWKATRELRFFPKIAELRELAGDLVGTSQDGRRGPEEAWAKMPKGDRIEDDTVVWCEEECAAYNACRPLLLEGDMIGARMAFKERYEREVAEARVAGKPVQWTISAGYDVEQRLVTLAIAVREKYITTAMALPFVSPERESDFARMLPPAETKGLLTGEISDLPNLPGLPGVLARMQMDGTLSDDLKGANTLSAQKTPSDRSPEEVRELREKVNAQKEFLNRSRQAQKLRTND